jgi:hypothetical protein
VLVASSLSSCIPSGPVNIVELLPFLFLAIASLSFLICAFSSSDNSEEGASIGACTGGKGGFWFKY